MKYNILYINFQCHIKTSVKVRIYEALRDWIIDGTLKPGERIVDTDISCYFAVSRTPVREVLHILVEQKVIEIFPVE